MDGMESHAPPSRSLPLHVIVTLLQFAVPEIMSPGEARVLCRGAASALGSPSFWRGMTATLDRDEGYEEPAAMVAGVSAKKRGSAARSPTKPRSNVDCLGSSGRGGSTRDGIGVRAAGKRNRADAGGDASGSTVAEGAGQTALGASARRFLRRYHHHVAFRRLSPPVADTEKVEMPVPLSPTCLDVCGCMVALGTREGPVLLFDVGPRPPGAGPPPSNEGSKPFTAATAVPADVTVSVTAAAASASSTFGGSTNRGDSASGSVSGTRHGGSPTHAANAAGAATSVRTSSGSATSASSVTRVYGSLAHGTGPISSVILDRAKVIAAGRGSRRSGGGYVVRIYAVDSTRLLRTLRCVSEVSGMCLFDPVLAVLSSGSGRLSFRDLYADGGSGLGQRTMPGVSAVAFAAVERQSSSSSSGNPGDQSVNSDHDTHVVLHCVDGRGTVFEASTSGIVWNIERDSISPAATPAEGAAARRGWHVCADLEASLLVRATPWGHVSGWRLHATGRRARGSIFGFRLGSSSASPSLAARRLTSVSLAAGGLFLATAGEGTAPKIWDLRLTRRSQRWGLASDAALAQGAAAGARGGVGGAGGAREHGGGAGNHHAAAPNGEHAEEVGDDGRARGGTRTRGRAREVRPWPAGAWAVDVAVDAGSGRLVSACSDGRMRVTKFRSNNDEARLRAAVLLSHRAKNTVAQQRDTPRSRTAS